MDRRKNATDGSGIEFECPCCHEKSAMSVACLAELGHEIATYDSRYDDPLDAASRLSTALLACLRKSKRSRMA